MMNELDLGTSQGPTTATHPTTTFLDLLRRQMSGADRTRRKRTLKERLRFKCIGCCGPTWGLRPTNSTLIQSLSSREEEVEVQGETRFVTDSHHRSGTGMNLATALESERYNRGDATETIAEIMTPKRVSLMRLLEERAETERVVAVDDRRETEILTTASMGNDSVCCVCMGRKKGAAFIPCGHTFCRVCSRELWLNRGACPLCNHPIMEILDIF